MSFRAAADKLRAGVAPDDLEDEERRSSELILSLAHHLWDNGPLEEMNGPAGKPRFVEALCAVTGDALLQELWARTWAVEAETVDYLPPDQALTSVFDSRTGQAWTPISEDTRRREGKRICRQRAERRERALLAGAEPVPGPITLGDPYGGGWRHVAADE